jgi:hypothetical protein
VPTQSHGLDAVVVIEMRMQGGHDQVVMTVLDLA